MCPTCSFDNPDEAKVCAKCSSSLRGLLGEKTLLGGRYELSSVLGCGAMGAVYLADDKRLVGRRCAIKENRPDPGVSAEAQAQSREQFLAEASVLARLDHPGLPKVSDYFIENGREYLVMDYVEGEDLESRSQRAKEPLEEAMVLNWIDQVLDALNYLHNQRPQPIIHRDIKPANLRVNTHGRVKLVDFGLVKLLDSKNPETKVELRGLGTPAYAPLEQFAGSGSHTDARSDIYALGATLYHMLTNLYPPDVHERLLNPNILIPPHELNAKLSPKTEQVILRAMEIYPDHRYQSAEEMRQALAADAPPVAAVPKAPAKKAAAPAVSPWLFGLLGVIFVLIILGSAIYLLFGGINGLSSSAQPPLVIAEEEPEATPTEFVVQSLSDAPTATPAPTQAEQPTTPVENTPTATRTSTPTATTTPSPEPTTATPVVSKQQEGIPASTLVGTIAYPIYNGSDYDLYFGQADGSGTELFLRSASQPAFSPDGTRIAYHSWRLDAWGLMTRSVSGSDSTLIATFVEDQLPTWTADGREIIFLSRREGDRKSRLIKVGSAQERSLGMVLSEGEYPTINLSGQLVFRGWGATGSGIRIANTSLQNIGVITTLDEDTAPALSPDGQKVVFMSRRDGNWEIYIANADGSEVQRLTEEPAEDGLPAWSPNGKAIAFASNRGGKWAVWAMTPEGEDLQQLFSMQGSPDGFVGSNIATAASRGWAEERISWKP
jgi:serine/threonine-protein kinase